MYVFLIAVQLFLFIEATLLLSLFFLSPEISCCLPSKTLFVMHTDSALAVPEFDCGDFVPESVNDYS